MQIILASSSPRRKELLSKIGLDFEVITSAVDETLEKDLSIEEQAKQLSYKKAKAVFEKTKGDRIVIGADTMVFFNNKLYGKPKTEEKAYQMLQELQGKKHEVITGICILVENNGEYREYKDYDISEVYIKNMSEKEIKTWIKSGKSLDKAGAYAIQEEFMIYIEKINGNYENIVGLPIAKIYDILKEYI